MSFTSWFMEYANGCNNILVVDRNEVSDVLDLAILAHASTYCKVDWSNYKPVSEGFDCDTTLILEIDNKHDDIDKLLTIIYNASRGYDNIVVHVKFSEEFFEELKQYDCFHLFDSIKNDQFIYCLFDGMFDESYITRRLAKHMKQVKSARNI